jgi:hypothetical protein
VDDVFAATVCETAGAVEQFKGVLRRGAWGWRCIEDRGIGTEIALRVAPGTNGEWGRES